MLTRWNGMFGRWCVMAMLCAVTVAGDAAAQMRPASPFPPRPEGGACEQRLRNLRAVATPSLTRDDLLEAYIPLFACPDPELGQGMASAIVALRTTTDSALAFMTFIGGFVYRDSAIVRASVHVAGDSSASELMRVLSFLSLYTTQAPKGYPAPLREFIAQPHDVSRCDFGFATDVGESVELTPRPPELVASIARVAATVRNDSTASRALRSAAACTLGVWRQ